MKWSPSERFCQDPEGSEAPEIATPSATFFTGEIHPAHRELGDAEHSVHGASDRRRWRRRPGATPCVRAPETRKATAESGRGVVVPPPPDCFCFSLAHHHLHGNNRTVDISNTWRKHH